MNKRFSTLLVAFAAVGVSAFAAVPNAPLKSANLPTSPTVATAVVSGEYYLLGTSATRVLSIVESASAKDSLVIGAIPSDLKTALWTIKKEATTALGDYYSFTNVSTGKVLSLDAKKDGIIVSDKYAEFGWSPAAATAFTHIKDGKTYTLTSTDNATTSVTDSLSLSDITATYDTQLLISAYLPAWKALSAKDLNDFNGSSFTWTVSGATSQTTAALASLAAISKKFTAVGIVDPTLASVDSTFYLKVLNSDKGTKAEYLNVDTVYYTRVGSLIDSTATNGGLTLGLDTLDAYVPKAGKDTASFKFSVWVNAKDSLIIEVGNVPTAAANRTFKQTSATHTRGVVSLVAFDGTSTALTASTPTASTVYPKVEFGQGSKVSLTKGAYFIYKKDQDSVYVATLATTLPKSTIVKEKVGEESALVPATQWSLSETTNAPLFKNRESGASFSSAKTLYKGSKDNEYYYGADTLIIKPVVTEGKYVGYKKFAATAAEEQITKVALQFNSALTEGLTAFVYTNDSILKAKNMDKEDAKYFNIVPTDTFAIGADSLVRVSYFLYSGKDTAAYDVTAAALKLSKTAKGAVVFRATKTEGYYQIIPLSSNYDAAVLDSSQVTVSGTDALATLTSGYSLLSGFFSFETPLAPEYAAVENGHYAISSVENPTLAISFNNDSIGVLKAETELKSDDAFAKENFSLFVEEYKADVVKPLYYIASQQTFSADKLALTEEEVAEDIRFLLTAKSDASGLKAIKAKRIGTALDSLHVYNVPAAQDTVKPVDNYSTFAFCKTTDTDEFYVQNDKTGKYLAQKNGILTLEADVDNSLAFKLGTSEAPVANDNVVAVTFSVVSSEGAILVKGAAGKKVVVSNILGQTIASTVLTSDNVTIAAPKGIVVVAVQGEEAVKAIVK
ncbi:MAG: DUF6383 domain-containing protein [Massilibacteroides sp.]|nr:DUF6383 domain-containing protein [Massilibacteroides sp.]